MIAEIEKLLAQIRSESGRDIAEAGASVYATDDSVHAATNDSVHADTNDSTPTTTKDSIQPTTSNSIHTGVAAIDQSGLRATRTRRVIELAGVPGSGKTHTLLRICATAVQSRHVLFIDTDGTLDLRLLARMTDGASTLQRVHVFRPATTMALVATLATLPKYAMAQNMKAPLIVIDSLGGSFLSDRRELAHVRLKVKRATPWFRMQQLLVDTLGAACVQMGAVCVAALELLHLASRSDAGPRNGTSEHRDANERVFRVGGREFRDAMIPRWQAMVLRSFVLEAGVGGIGDGLLTRVAFVCDGHRAHAHIGPDGLGQSVR